MSDDFSNLLGLIGGAFGELSLDSEKATGEYNVLYEDKKSRSIGLCDKCGTRFPINNRNVYMISTPNGEKKAYFTYCDSCNKIIEVRKENNGNT